MKTVKRILCALGIHWYELAYVAHFRHHRMEVKRCERCGAEVEARVTW